MDRRYINKITMKRISVIINRSIGSYFDICAATSPDS